MYRLIAAAKRRQKKPNPTMENWSRNGWKGAESAQDAAVRLSAMATDKHGNREEAADVLKGSQKQLTSAKADCVPG